MRNQYFDIIKGFTIFLVVLGHVIQSFMPNYEKNSLFLFIYSFHMPLFITIAGYFFLHSVDKVDSITFIKNKFQRLMLPSLSMGAINCCIVFCGKLLNHKEINIAFFLDLLFTGLWFLSTLFILSVIGCFLRKILKNYMYWGWIIITIVLYFIPNIYLSHELKYLTPFFVGAIALSRYNWEEISNKVLLLSVVPFFILLSQFTFPMSLYEMQDDFFTINHLYIYLYRMFIGVLGCLFSMFVCKLIRGNICLGKCAMFLGTISLPIYAIHQKFLDWNLFVHISVANMFLIVSITFIVIVLSIITYRLIGRNKIISLFLFGEKTYDK